MATAQRLVANAIEGSSEARDHLVKSWYVSYLGRQAAGNEETPFVGRLLGNATTPAQSEETVLAAFLSDASGFNKPPTGAGPLSETAFIAKLYQVVLHRIGSAADMASWHSIFQAGGYSAVAKGFLTGPEFRQDQFEGYYDALLHRPGDNGLSGWVGSADDLFTVRTKFESTNNEFYNNG